MNTVWYVLGAIALIIAVIVVLWALRIVSIVKVLAPFLKKYRRPEEYANKAVQYMIKWEGGSLFLGTERGNREFLIFGTVKGSSIQISNHLNIPVYLQYRHFKPALTIRTLKRCSSR
jgi:hypothetical protein